MATLDELPLRYRVFVRTYPWRRIDPIPWAPLAKPLETCRLAIVSSAGFTLPGQPAFDDTVRGGDWSWRLVPSGADPRSLTSSHRSTAFDARGMAADPNLAFPLDRLRERVASGRIGSVATNHVSLMGSITAPGRLMRDTAPAVAEALAADGVDAALLVPV